MPSTQTDFDSDPLASSPASAAIAAASIVAAKETRDGLMRQLEVEHPGYGFATHKGYGTPFAFDEDPRIGLVRLPFLRYMVGIVRFVAYRCAVASASSARSASSVVAISRAFPADARSRVGLRDGIRLKRGKT
ncbi:MAG: hypothetical protein ACSLFF_03445 [Solirubrobacterales bacterium]